MTLNHTFPSLINQKVELQIALEKEKKKIGVLEKEIEKLKEDHVLDLENEEKKKRMSMYILEQKRSNMSALYDAEIE